MRGTTLAALVAALPLVGCPLPQALPDYPPGTITPPRILLAASSFPGESFVPVPASCPGDPVFDLAARIFYQDNRTVEARWFVDYKRDEPSRYAIQNTIREVPAAPDPTVLERDVPGFRFHAYGYPPPPELGLGADDRAPGVVHVVELVVSNGFDPAPDAPEPNRTPAINGAVRFEIQSARWVFVNVANLPCP